MSKVITFENKYYSKTQEILNSIKQDESLDLLIDLSKTQNQGSAGNKEQVPRGFQTDVGVYEFTKPRTEENSLFNGIRKSN